VCSPANARAVLGGQGYGNSSEGYWLTSVQCDGSETDVEACRRSNWGDVTGCDVNEAAGVSCLPDSSALPPRTISQSVSQSINQSSSSFYLLQKQYGMSFK